MLSIIVVEVKRETRRLFESLVEAAVLARRNSYAPYSRFAVGAAIMGSDGRMYSGCNVENASYGLTICAERVAIGTMIAGGCREISAVAVALEGSGSPCGACRQVMSEFGERFPVLMVNLADENSVQQWTIDQLLPVAFRLNRSDIDR